MIGIAIAIITTLLVSEMSGMALILSLGGLAIGGAVGARIAKKIPMTDMPQLVAAFHSLVGLAAVLVAVAAFFSPIAFGIHDHVHLLEFLGISAEAFASGNTVIPDDYTPRLKPGSLLELGLGAAIGAITFSGSVIAFAKLNGNMSGAPIMLPARHIINIVLGLVIAVLIGMLMKSGGTEPWIIWALLAATCLLYTSPSPRDRG